MGTTEVFIMRGNCKLQHMNTTEYTPISPLRGLQKVHGKHIVQKSMPGFQFLLHRNKHNFNSTFSTRFLEVP